MLKLPSRDKQLPIMLLAFVYHTLWQYPSQYPSDFSEPYVQTKFKKSTSCWQQAGLLKHKTTQNKWSHSQASACLTQSFRAVFFSTSHELNCSPALCYYLMRCYLYKTFVYYFRGYLCWTPDSPCVCIWYTRSPAISAFLSNHTNPHIIHV